ncbi:MAG: response regulator, partial [Myxococcota bacterium]
MESSEAALLRAAIELIADCGFFVLDEEGRYVAFNGHHAAAIESFAGRPPRVGEPYLDALKRTRPEATAAAPTRIQSTEDRLRAGVEVQFSPLGPGGAMVGQHAPLVAPSPDAPTPCPIPRLAEGVLNELNNLGVGISGALEALSGSTPAVSAASELLEQVRERSSRAARLGQVINSSVMAPPSVEVEVDALLVALEHDLRSVTRAKVAVERDAARARVRAEVREIRDALLEVVRNAEEASADHVTIRSRVVSEAEDGPPWPSIEIAVEDDGEGLHPDHVARYFEPYVGSRKGAQGLGLTRVRSIARAHGGAVVVSTTAEGRTCICLRLPRVVDERKVEPAPEPTVREHQRILVVDDAPEVRRVLGRVLRHDGHEVAEAEDGIDALEKLDAAEHYPDLIVLDLMMPRMDGVETYNALRARKARLPILITSGYHPSSLAF